MFNYRVYVEKRLGYRTESNSLLKELVENFHLSLEDLRIIQIYDLFHINQDELDGVKKHVLSEVVTDLVYDHINLDHENFVAVEYLPGQYDQRADSAEQCIKLICQNQNIRVKTGKLFIIKGNISKEELEKVKNYLINRVEMREKNLFSQLLLQEKVEVEAIKTLENFINYNKEELSNFLNNRQLAMTLDDLYHIQNYFKNSEKRNPTETEILVLDTYWSDHCRHTTFETILSHIKFPENELFAILQKTFNDYITLRKQVHQESKPMTLMDLATIKAKSMKKSNELLDLEISNEINACSVYIDVDVDGVMEKWLLMFKNETHNHPTEIEPFGGASTCIGGAIRDPLSGRAYVYQAMRVTGAGNILERVEDTLEGKLPQKIISKKAAEGYSSYGNQIGLATTHVREIYHDGYKAKRMEVGAVIGAVKANDIKREEPLPGDLIILIGGKTGRDGIGGATGSSKGHDVDSIETSSSEVQKGNAPTERKLQRLFRNPKVTQLIKKSNDFGAGGVSVAIGELASGLEINLDLIPTKYSGLNANELALSESQERMAVVISKDDLISFTKLVETENLDATVVASVTDSNRLIMKYKEEVVVNISRDFLNTNGVRQRMTVELNDLENISPFKREIQGTTLCEKFLNNLKDPNVASQKGLVEMFDSTIGSTTVLMPFGGKYQLTEVDASVQKIPVIKGETNTCSLMTYGYNPYISSWSPFHGAIYAIIESVTKFVCVGGDYKKIRFSFQEYFKKLGTNPKNWGEAFASLLGALHAQNEFNLPAIGGKDSMSGTFKDIHVPPTLISFAFGTESAHQIISPEFKAPNHYVYMIKGEVNESYIPNIKLLKENFEYMYENIKKGNILSAFPIKNGGLAEALAKMSFGNKIGIQVERDLNLDLFNLDYGSIVVESKVKLYHQHAIFLGKTIDEEKLILNNETILINEAIKSWASLYETVYPVTLNSKTTVITTPTFKQKTIVKNGRNVIPQVFIPVFPGTNCEYDSMKAFERAGAKTQSFVFKNRNEDDIRTSIDQMKHYIDQSQILMLSGGFSAGDEPDGSGKFITAILLNEQIKESIERFLERDGLILGICNGFQALIKSGLLPYGEIGKVIETSPTLYRNDINRHVSQIVQTRITSNKSPWLNSFEVGEVHQIAVSHGEGKFVASSSEIHSLILNGQVATQYVDYEGIPTHLGTFNPNGSIGAIEGITSKDGRILGKMGHSERYGNHLYKNINGNKQQNIFINGVNYFI